MTEEAEEVEEVVIDRQKMIRAGPGGRGSGEPGGTEGLRLVACEAMVVWMQAGTWGREVTCVRGPSEELSSAGFKGLRCVDGRKCGFGLLSWAVPRPCFSPLSTEPDPFVAVKHRPFSLHRRYKRVRSYSEDYSERESWKGGVASASVSSRTGLIALEFAEEGDARAAVSPPVFAHEHPSPGAVGGAHKREVSAKANCAPDTYGLDEVGRRGESQA
ncbi:hypothetical protein SKAU_G00429440 [Synaphobranchus kaupii]|uniref:Uncharacterized protein n=1 Tax=Synaphobranchus kaupii TaxID=118154 RepID=A0A9Q1IA46_SYNKA|nr:hypothetical protein SKAU_G00429440 [Synaphobranchus kaupii]